jgi:hypothetical protein
LPFKVSVAENDDDFGGSEAFCGSGVCFDFFDTIDIYIEYLEFDTEVDFNLIGAGIMLNLF